MPGADRAEPFHPLEEVLHAVTEMATATVEWFSASTR